MSITRISISGGDAFAEARQKAVEAWNNPDLKAQQKVVEAWNNPNLKAEARQKAVEAWSNPDLTWERSNRISQMIMKGSITTIIRGAIPDSDNAKLYLAHIEEQFQGSSKAHATTLITKMVTLKYSGSNGVREHILQMNDMASQLKGLDMEISEVDAPLNTWWVDTGATVHITNSLQGFLSVKKLNKGDRNVLVGNGEKAQVEAVGTLRLVLESGFNLDLVDTVYVPSMTRNFISVSRLDAYGYSFKGFSLFLYSRVIGSSLLEGNLYKLLLNASFTGSLKIMNVNDVVAKICGYPERSKGFRFYCPSHTTRIVETRHAVFFEDAEYSGSCTPRIINLEEIQDHVSIPVIQKVGAPLLHREDNDAPEVIPNDVPPIMDHAPIPANEQPLRRSGRERNDILLASSDMHMLHETKNFMSKNFDMKDLGEASYVIGIEIHRDRSRGILGLSQRAYIDKVLKRFNMHNCAPTVAPVVKGDKFSLLQCPRNQLEQDEMERIPYASAVGSLMYAQVCTRPDIAYVVGMLGRYQMNPGMGNWLAAKKVMRYL
ncbi:hypothetical protein RJ640_018216 [Escallonia rubra]|uniref:Reverse transcriptase Ty1/copia-type domain-containing protein n=1 Tax=Escallonia rubra TaxID=112253 RepID=A0AA88U5D1_9ASTE|nr:hypothetical protein RJ640_018216 [Escallonia rubra]